MFHKILVALLDNIDSANYIFEKALDLAKVNNAEMMLVHVISPFEKPYPMYVYSSNIIPSLHDDILKQHMQDLEKLQQEGVKFLNSLCNRALECGVKAEFTQNIGSPSRVICEMAENYKADLIIIGRRSHSEISEFFLGSVSNYVFHHAPCSVLTVQKVVQPDTKELETVEAVA